MKLAKQKNDGQGRYNPKIDSNAVVHNPAKDLFHLWSNFDNLSADWDASARPGSW
jgi:uncharacterized membrane protein